MAGPLTLRDPTRGARVTSEGVRRRGLWAWFAALLLAAAAAAAAVAAARVHAFVNEPVPWPDVRPLDVLSLVTDTRAVSITTTVAWTKIPQVVTVHRLLTDRPLWSRMHFDDWDRVPPAVREPALEAMVAAYARVLRGPRVWRTMTVYDWDRVPQPIRAMAYLRMIWYWARVEQVGAQFDMNPNILAQTIAGIVMAESWFEHRALNENAFGNRDLGLAQCSDHCRKVMSEMAAANEIAFAPEGDDYFDPWVGTRVATVWFQRELRRAEGDVELAIRAYHRGITNAYDQKGDVYLEGVRRRRDRYVLNRNPPASWRFLVKSMAPL